MLVLVVPSLQVTVAGADAPGACAMTIAGTKSPVNAVYASHFILLLMILSVSKVFESLPTNREKPSLLLANMAMQGPPVQPQEWLGHHIVADRSAPLASRPLSVTTMSSVATITTVHASTGAKLPP